MRTIQLDPNFITNEHCNFEVDERGVIIEANNTIEDVWINNPSVEVLWWIGCPHSVEHPEDFPDDKGFLLPAKNDPKEFTNVRCNRMSFRSLQGKGRIYLMIQRN